ncbi:MAG: CRISPR system precrRNA processing endoribonuclease RAMP protein Cas6, partial [Ignavibacteriaceae bacterium]|nr:CRISPR system precrRNA processing endoribonuclease RAMP protein Cas6 [Ignavibacteriaceae bacterium]
ASSNQFNNLTFSTFEFTAEVTETVVWTPGFKGILLRDSVGNVLKNILTPERFTYLWNNKLSKSVSETEQIGEDAPRGYILEPPSGNKRKYNDGELFTFRLTLIGRFTEYLNDFAEAFEKLGTDYWLGRKKGYGCGKYKIKSVNLINNKINYDEANQTQNKNLVLNFITPTRIVNEETKKPLMYNGSDILTFTFLLKSLYKRLYLLDKIVCENNETKYLPESVLAYTDEVKTTGSSLIFHDLENHTSKGIQKFGGFTGEVIFQGDIAPYLQMIKLGESLHVGRDYVYGMGRYEVL